MDRETFDQAAIARLLHRPIYGGLFGSGRWALATLAEVEHGLHHIRFMVIDPRGGAVLSVAEDKVEALETARRVLRAAGELGEAANDSHAPQQTEFWPLEVRELRPAARPVSARRRRIFTRTQGRCFYCDAELELHGRWHVEHMQPRALGGTDGCLNLVAACAACNLAKSDRTALEFLAGRASG